MDPVRRVNTTMPASLLRRVDLYAGLNLEDRATAIRQLVAEGLRVKLRERVLDQFRAGKITIRQAAELLGVAYVEMDDILRENRIPLVDDIELGLERALTRAAERPAKRGRRRPERRTNRLR